MDFDLEVMIKEIKDLTVTPKLWSTRRYIEAVLKNASEKTISNEEHRAALREKIRIQDVVIELQKHLICMNDIVGNFASTLNKKV